MEDSGIANIDNYIELNPEIAGYRELLLEIYEQGVKAKCKPSLTSEWTDFTQEGYEKFLSEGNDKFYWPMLEQLAISGEAFIYDREYIGLDLLVNTLKSDYPKLKEGACGKLLSKIKKKRVMKKKVLNSSEAMLDEGEVKNVIEPSKKIKKQKARTIDLTDEPIKHKASYSRKLFEMKNGGEEDKTEPQILMSDLLEKKRKYSDNIVSSLCEDNGSGSEQPDEYSDDINLNNSISLGSVDTDKLSKKPKGKGGRKGVRQGRNLIGTPLKSPKKFDSLGFGIVVMGESDVYTSSPVINESIHLAAPLKSIAEAIKKMIINKFFVSPIGVIVAHEHGKGHNKCHYQCAIRFDKRFNRTVQPYAEVVDEVKYLFMFQKSVNIGSLWNYCKKDGQFAEIGNEGPKISSVYDVICSDKTRTKEEVMELAIRGDAKGALFFGHNLTANYENLVKQAELPEFKWTFPQHLIDYMNDESKEDPRDLEDKAKVKGIFNWFTENCLSGNPGRKQSLFLFSPERGIGKTFFAKSLCNEGLFEDFIIYNRGSLDAKEFIAKEKTAKLVILDDVSYITDDKEMWKALISSEPVSINTKFKLHYFKNGLPCIVLTNELSVCHYWWSSPIFNTQCVFVNLRYYLGVEGTRPKFLEKKATFFDNEFESELFEFDEFKKQKKNAFDAMKKKY